MSSLDLLLIKAVKTFIHSFDLFGLPTGGYFIIICIAGILIKVLDIKGKKVSKR